MEAMSSPSTAWFEQQLFQTHPVLQLTLTATLVGAAGLCSIECITISGDDPLSLEAWTWQLAPLGAVVTSSIDSLRQALNEAIDSLCPF